MFQVFHPSTFCKAKIVAGKSFKKKGFTIIEILVVIFITVVLSAIVFANYRSGQQQLVLKRTAYKLAQDIRRAQSMAGLESPKCDNSDYRYAYGIHLKINDPKTYILFSDCNVNQKYNSEGDENLEDIELEKGVKIKSLEGNNILDIVFVPPDPVVFIRGSVNISSIKITLCLEDDPAEIKEIIVYRSGLIDID